MELAEVKRQTPTVDRLLNSLFKLQRLENEGQDVLELLGETERNLWKRVDERI